MHGGHENVVRLSHKAVDDVYYNASWNGRSFDPVPGFRKGFEPGVGVLREEGEAFKVRVRTNAELIGGRGLGMIRLVLQIFIE
jgi:hypothetical protein